VSRRVFASLGAIALFAGLSGAQTSNAWTPPHTADGKPDLQGVWSNASNTPLERPKELGAKEFYTPQEAADLEKRTSQQRQAPAGAGTTGDVHYDLAQYGLDRSHATVAANLRTSLIVGPEGRVPPLTPEAQKRVAERAEAVKGHQFDSAKTRPLSERCIVWPNEGPPMMPVGYNSDLQIVQGPGYVAILQEMIHDVRMIPTDGRPHLPAGVQQFLGDSRGHWEGDTLVVDTTNFTDRTAFRNSTASLHVVERFTRVNENTLKYEFTVSDPATWEKSWSAEVPMVKINSPIYEYACQEGNYGMANVLSGVRATEAKAEAAKGSH
jgi:hypothetical protein